MSPPTIIARIVTQNINIDLCIPGVFDIHNTWVIVLKLKLFVIMPLQ